MRILLGGAAALILLAGAGCANTYEPGSVYDMNAPSTPDPYQLSTPSGGLVPGQLPR